MLFFNKEGKNAPLVTNKICAIYGEAVEAKRTVWKWIARIKAGNYILEYKERLSRLSTPDIVQIKTLIENNINSEKFCSQLD